MFLTKEEREKVIVTYHAVFLEKKWTQSQAAKMLGITQGHLNNILSRRRKPTTQVLEKMSLTAISKK